MRGRWAVVLALGLAAGCVPVKTTESDSWLTNLRPFQGPMGSDVVSLDVALLERPLGDPFLNEELWQTADERVVGPERRAVMEGSGFRVGLVAGPSRLLDLLAASPEEMESRRRQTRAGKPWPLSLGPALKVCCFEIEHGDDLEEVEFHKAECQLVVTAMPVRDGRTLLRFVPRVVHGEAEQAFQVAEDRSTLQMVEQRPSREFKDLFWEATLSPNDYLVVGGRYDGPETLGHQGFVRPDEAKPVQRLLVIRARAMQAETKVKAQALPGAKDDEAALAKTPPLARQAAGQ